MKKNIASKPKIKPPIPWREIKSWKIHSYPPYGNLVIGAEEFVERVQKKGGFYGAALKLGKNILLELCETGDQVIARVARSILLKSGEKNIPKESTIKHGAKHQILRSFQVNPALLIRPVKHTIKQIKPLITHKLKRKEVEPDIKKAFALILKREPTQEELDEIRKRIGAGKRNWVLPELSIFFLCCELNSILQEQSVPLRLSFKELTKVYYRAKKEREEIEALIEDFDDIGMLTKKEREMYLKTPGPKGFLTGRFKKGR